MLRKVKFKGFSKRADSEEDTDPSLLRKNVVLKRNQNISQNYIIGEFLGSGKFGEVKRCTEKETGGQFAAKFISASAKDDFDSALNEIAIMNRLRHPRLVQLYDAYSWASEVILVVELITGGELFERIIDESFDLTESRCIRFMNEILQGVEFIHSQNILHLDLKPENVLCLSKTSFKIKIIDFGLARFYDSQDMCVMLGTPEFVAPEVISYDPVSPASDMWSLGVICYVMLSGLSPFMGDTPGETMSNILKVTYNFNYPEFGEISEDAIAFIRLLLVKDPRKRPTATECLQHPWIKKKRTPKRKGTVSKKRLKHFVYRRKWQKAVNAIIALLRMGVVLQPDPTYRTGSAVPMPAKATAPTPTRDVPRPTTSGTRTTAKDDLSKTKMSINETVKPASKLPGKEAKSEAVQTGKASKTRRPSLLSRLTRASSSESSRRNSKFSISDDGKSDSKSSGKNSTGKKETNASLWKKEETNKTNKTKLPTIFTGDAKTGNINTDDHRVNVQSVSSSSKKNENTDGTKKKNKPSPVLHPVPASNSLKLGISPLPSSSKSTPYRTERVPDSHSQKPDPPKVVKVNNKSLPIASGIASKIGFFSNLAKEDPRSAKR